MKFEDDQDEPRTLVISDPQPPRDCADAARSLLTGAPRAGSDARLRMDFVARLDGHDLPPIVRLARFGAVALRLELCFLWLGACGALNGEGPTPLRVQDLVAATGIPAGHNGTRRVDHALTELEARGFISLHGTTRGSRAIQLHREDRSAAWTEAPLPRRPYQRPGETRERYLTIPQGFWTHGWSAVLSPSALVVMLALDYMRAAIERKPTGLGDTSEPEGHEPELRVFISDSMRQRRFGFSEDLYYQGRRELEQLGVLRLSWEPVASRSEAYRTRATALLRDWVFHTDPTDARRSRLLERRGVTDQ